MINDWCRLDKSAIIQRLQWAVLCFGLVLTFVLAFKLRLPDLNWQIALGGWSAIDWVAHLRFPERYILDFQNGMNIYDKSSVMYVYPFLNRAFDIPVENIIPVMVFLEMCFLAGASIFFVRSLNGQVSPVGSFIFALLVVLSPARDIDLSNFGAPFFWGLFYNFADGLRLLGVAFFLRRKPLRGGLLLGIGFTIHPIIILFGSAFIAGFLVFERHWVGIKGLFLGALAFLVISGAWLIYLYDFSSVVFSQVNPQVWIRMARAFSFHFFPVDYGLLTIDFHKRLLPLLVLCLLALHYLPAVCDDRGLRRGVVGGCLVLVMLIAAGLLISLYAPIPVLIKLALPRASALLVLIAMAISSVGLIRDIENGSVIQRILGLMITLSPFVYSPGFPLIPVALLILVNRRDHRDGYDSNHRAVELAALVSMLAVVVEFWWAGYVQFHHMSSYTGFFAQFDYWQFVVLVALLLFCFSIFARQSVKEGLSTGRWRGGAPAFAPVIVFFFVCYLGLAWQKSLLPGPSYRALGLSYLDAQRWARTNSPEQSLFMVDPSIYYGWRDFSERSSFGNLREWLHTSWLYDSRADRYEAGLQHFGEFGIPLDQYLDQPVSRLLGFQKLTVDIQKRFYEFDEKWFSFIRERYGVSHVVMQKNGLVRDYSFERVFENDHFVVFDLARIAR